MKMLLRALVFALAATRSNSAQVSLQFTRTTHRNAAAWKLPSFIKSGRVTGRQRNPPPVSTTVSQVLLEVRGGSDNYSGNDPDGRYYNNYDNDYSRRRPNKDKRDDYYEEKRVDDYYYGEQPDGSYYEEDRHYEEYDDRGRGGRSRDNSPGFSASGIPSVIKNGDRKIGMSLLAMGAFFTISGVFLFFHKTLLRLGNLLFIAGVPMTIGPGRTAGYFLQPQKARATGFLALGVFLVFMGWPILGMALEIFGLLNIFGNMMPLAMAVLKQMPIVGGLFKSFNGNSSRRRNDRRDDDRYYEDDRYSDDRYYGDDDKGGDSYY